MKKIYTDEQIVGFIREAKKSEATISNFVGRKVFTKTRFGVIRAKERPTAE